MMCGCESYPEYSTNYLSCNDDYVKQTCTNFTIKLIFTKSFTKKLHNCEEKCEAFDWLREIIRLSHDLNQEP